MRISPPIGALAVVAVAIVGTAWLAPAATEAHGVSVMLPADVYQDLELRGRRQLGENGAARTVPQVIEWLASQTAETAPEKD